MIKSKFGRIAGGALLVFMFLLGTNLYAQNNVSKAQQKDPYRKNAQAWAMQLNSKIKLTNDQQAKIEAILVSYQKDKMNTAKSKDAVLNKDYSSKVESVLNESQKQMYNGYKAEWWKNIDTPASTKNTY
jgi:hypothetical protein